MNLILFIVGNILFSFSLYSSDSADRDLFMCIGLSVHIANIMIHIEKLDKKVDK